ncbi:hypothetical protein Salat_2162700 [Sesamum alatum]|uniref:Uncharacterized protein n=1 Tax=Sesamum alatum TaxID=300844 RepID=A0AAE2CHB6_9LAMI|nr:hypothetical protein Salat_2162700 [Sesamum alatum]
MEWLRSLTSILLTWVQIPADATSSHDCALTWPRDIRPRRNPGCWSGLEAVPRARAPPPPPPLPGGSPARGMDRPARGTSLELEPPRAVARGTAARGCLEPHSGPRLPRAGAASSRPARGCLEALMWCLLAKMAVHY